MLMEIKSVEEFQNDTNIANVINKASTQLNKACNFYKTLLREMASSTFGAEFVVEYGFLIPVILLPNISIDRLKTLQKNVDVGIARMSKRMEISIH